MDHCFDYSKIKSIVPGYSNLVEVGQSTQIYVSNLINFILGQVIFISSSLSNQNNTNGYFEITKIIEDNDCYPKLEIKNIDQSDILLCNCSCIHPASPKGATGPQGYTGFGGLSKVSNETLNIKNASDSYLITNDINNTNIVNNQTKNWLSTFYSTNANFFPNVSVANDGIYVLAVGSVFTVFDGLNCSYPPSLNISYTGASIPSKQMALIKYDFDGKTLWGAQIITSNQFGAAGQAVLKATNDGVYISCAFQGGTVTVYDSPNGQTSSLTLSTPTNSISAFIVKFNNQGKGIWITRMTSSLQNAQIGILDIKVSLDAIYICGVLSIGTLTLFNEPGNIPAISSSPQINGFILKYDLNGNAIWITGGAGYNNNSLSTILIPLGMSVLDNNIYVSAAIFSNILTTNNIKIFDSPDGSGPPVITGPFTNAYTGYIIKFDINGKAKWLSRIIDNNNSLNPSFSSIRISAYIDGLYVCGITLGSQLSIYGPPNGSPPILLSSAITASGSKGFIIKFNLDGLPLWIAFLNGTTSAGCYDISVNSEGVYVVGQFTGTTVNVYDSPIGSAPPSITGPGTPIQNGVIVKFDHNGKALWLNRESLQTVTSANDSIVCFEIDAKNDGVYITSLGSSLLTNQINVFTKNNGSSPVTLSCPIYYTSFGSLLKLNPNGDFTSIFLEATNPAQCPTKKLISYNSNSNSGITILPQDTILDSNIGVISSMTTTTNGANLTLLYSPTPSIPTTDWFILENNGFTLN